MSSGDTPPGVMKSSSVIVQHECGTVITEEDDRNDRNHGCLRDNNDLDTAQHNTTRIMSFGAARNSAASGEPRERISEAVDRSQERAQEEEAELFEAKAAHFAASKYRPYTSNDIHPALSQLDRDVEEKIQRGIEQSRLWAHYHPGAYPQDPGERIIQQENHPSYMERRQQHSDSSVVHLPFHRQQLITDDVERTDETRLRDKKDRYRFHLLYVLRWCSICLAFTISVIVAVTIILFLIPWKYGGS